ncbi:XRE family transcriptional regulator [Coprococcus eutactus]|uniref:XRE family transcriptional regulator n=1 Tax=Coprococcus eutactus TaxID=33043 RepID=A0A3R5ZLH2_9FIRM|nr:XRE family transcriptional regulator [Coprococcus eutactus]
MLKVDVKKLYIAMANCCMGRRELAKASGVPETTICNIINHKSTRPATLGKIAKALKVDAAVLVADEEL